jgi:hypothetical protein
MKFLFYDLLTINYTVGKPYKEGLGGTQSAICYYCEYLVKKGHEVILINDSENSLIENGVQHYPYDWYNSQKNKIITDVFVLCGVALPDFINNYTNRIDYKLSIFWHGHYIFERAVQYTSQIVYGIDVFAFVTEYQRNKFCETFNIPLYKTMLMPYGVSPFFIQNIDATEKELELIYLSVPDRGLINFLEIWPKVYEKHPDAKLKLFSSRKTYGLSDSDFILSYKNKLAVIPGVEMNEPVGQKELASICAKAAFFCYPCHFVETSCICLHETRAAGCIPIISDLGVFDYTLENTIPFDSKFIENFTNETINQINKFKLDRESFNKESNILSKQIQTDMNYSNVIDSYVKNLEQLIKIKNKAMSRHLLLENSKQNIYIYESTPFYFKNNIHAATFFMNMGILYIETSYTHMAEIYLKRAYEIIQSDLILQRILEYYIKTNNMSMFMEYYFKIKNRYNVSKQIHNTFSKLYSFTQVANTFVYENDKLYRNETSGMDFFKDKYVISIDSDIDRRNYITKHLKEKNISFSFFDAIDARSEEAFESLKKYSLSKDIISENCIKLIKPGQLGCLLSHLKLWEEIVTNKKDDKWVLIMEDDVYFENISNDIINKYLNCLPLNAKHIKLCWMATKFHFNNNRIESLNNFIVKFHDRGVPTTMCYAIHTSILEELLSKKFESVIDDIVIPNSYGFKYLDNNNLHIKSDNYKNVIYGICNERSMNNSHIL